MAKGRQPLKYPISSLECGNLSNVGRILFIIQALGFEIATLNVINSATKSYYLKLPNAISIYLYLFMYISYFTSKC